MTDEPIEHVFTVMYLLHRAGVILNLHVQLLYQSNFELGTRDNPKLIGTRFVHFKRHRRLKPLSTSSRSEVIHGSMLLYSGASFRTSPKFVFYATPAKNASPKSSTTCRLRKWTLSQQYSRTSYHLCCLHGLVTRTFERYTLINATITRLCTEARSATWSQDTTMKFLPNAYLDRETLWHDASWTSTCSLSHLPPKTLSYPKELRFAVCTDHDALIKILNLANSTRRLPGGN